MSDTRCRGCEFTLAECRSAIRQGAKACCPDCSHGQVTLATPGVEPVSRDGVEPTPGDLGIFRSIADLATRGLVHFVEAGDVIPVGLSFKRYDRGGDRGTRVIVSLTDGDTVRLRMDLQADKDPNFELLIDNSQNRGPEWLADVAEVVKGDRTAVGILELALVLARQAAQQATTGPTDGQRSAMLLKDLADYRRELPTNACGDIRQALVGKPGVRCHLVKGHAGDHANGSITWAS
jgi:hypothetical protein